MKNSLQHRTTPIIGLVQSLERIMGSRIPYLLARDLFHRDDREAVRLAKRFRRSVIFRLFHPLFQWSNQYRPCERTLCYVGLHWVDDGDLRSRFDAEEEFFQIGEFYQSEEFNGATYKIKGTNRAIGCAYFDVVSEERPFGG